MKKFERESDQARLDKRCILESDFRSQSSFFTFHRFTGKERKKTDVWIRQNFVVKSQKSIRNDPDKSEFRTFLLLFSRLSNARRRHVPRLIKLENLRRKGQQKAPLVLPRKGRPPGKPDAKKKDKKEEAPKKKPSRPVEIDQVSSSSNVSSPTCSYRSGLPLHSRRLSHPPSTPCEEPLHHLPSCYSPAGSFVSSGHDQSRSLFHFDNRGLQNF